MSNKNPLIPMGAITGDLTREQIHTMLKRYADAGIEQFLMYPRDGCDVPYMSERWLEICGDIIEYAAELGIDIWLYDEFNWPSGTCKGAVMAENPDFRGAAVKIQDGEAEIIRCDTYADILNPDAVDAFIRLTHDVYFERFGSYFGTTIKGIFTDEPSFMYCGGTFPYSIGIEKLYYAETGRDLFWDFANPSHEFTQNYYKLLGKRFREVFIGRIADWCRAHRILLTGHLLGEDSMRSSVSCNGNAIEVLRGFSLPGMDEISTVTSIEGAEWLTLGCAQAAIRAAGRGGLAELFALGPTDLVPARVEQMLWLEAMFGIDHYVLAVSAADARGNVKKNGWFNPMNYMNPWFAGYPALGESAKKAAEFAKKEIAVNVFFRYPASLTAKYLHDEEYKLLTTHRTKELLSLLTREQYQWLMLDETEFAPEGVPVIQITDVANFNAAELVEYLNFAVARRIRVLDENGAVPADVFVREFTDGSYVVLDLSDSAEPRRLFVHNGDETKEITLAGRGHYCSDEAPRAEYPTCTALTPTFRMTIDRPNTLRVNIRKDCTEYTFTAAEKLDGIRLLMRNYLPGGEISLDGVKMTADAPADALTPGLSGLYDATGAFTLEAGVHTLTITAPAESEPFLPSCFVCGYFASDDTDTLRPLPDTVGLGDLRGVLPQFAGKITYETEITLDDFAALALDCSELYTRVYADGMLLGEALADFRFAIPDALHGKTVTLKIEQFTSIAPIFGRASDVIAQGDGVKWAALDRWFPGKYQKCGISSVALLR